MVPSGTSGPISPDDRGGVRVRAGALDLGRGVHEDKLEPKAVVRSPLATTNRHGLIAGATGTGKTKSLQMLAEQLSAAGVWSSLRT
jgi:DNA double-strand break repair helicase HerA and related ATPase